MANNNSSKEKFKFKDLIKAAKRNYKRAPKKNLYWFIGCVIAVVALFAVWIADLVNIFA